MDRNIIEKDGFYFIHNFDSGNLGHVERVPTELIVASVNHKTNINETPDYEFNLWTRPDCAGTEFENGNRTWFYFGIQATEPGILVRLNLINLNKQGKMYNQGMAPVTRTLPGKPQWERIKDRPVHSMDDNTFSLSFKYRTSENLKATTFFAFTYPFSFAELQIALYSIDLKMLPLPPPQTPDDIYYCRECLIYSLEGRRVDLLTISSHHGITNEREDRLKNLFPDNQERAFKFKNKKIIFMSARVHPGETPSSFVFNGFLTLLLSRNDPVAVKLRQLYVFKLIPFLNPDGVARGHYRTDTRGVNLNRVYLNPSLTLHPTVYASRALIRYYHFGCEKEDIIDEESIDMCASSGNICEKKSNIESNKPPRKMGVINGKKLLDTSLPTCAKKWIRSTLDAAETNEQQDSTNREISTQASYTETEKSITSDVNQLLNNNVLLNCLGVNVHIASSTDLSNIGPNPMKPLRDTLKNSISLLMESHSMNLNELPSQGSIKMGICKECRAAGKKPESNLPGFSFDAHEEFIRTSHFFNDINQYREYQKQQFDDEERKAREEEMKNAKPGECFFCTNCFKRFMVTATDEVKIKEPESGTALQEEETTATESEMAAVEMCSNRSSTPLPASGSSPSPPPRVSKSKHAQKPVPPKSAPSPTPPNVIPAKPAPSVANKKKPTPPKPPPPKQIKENESGLFLYIDLHGHASKKGIFMYGNHFTELDNSVECMMLPRIMSLNNMHFHFSSCNFTERNMYLKDRRDGMSREGSGRVAVLKATGLVRSYTLECNYNTGRLINVLPPTIKEGPTAPPLVINSPLPPKYTPHIYEEIRQNAIRMNNRDKNLEVFEEMNALQVGVSLGASILDLTGQHPNSRIPCSEHRTLASVRDWLRNHQRTMKPSMPMSRVRPKTSSPIRVPLFNKGKATDERKENAYAGSKTETDRAKRQVPVFRQDICNMNVKVTRKPEAVKSTSRTRCPVETETKTSLTSKRRTILAIRKPNATKPQGAIVKSKVVTRRSADDSGRHPSTKVSKRSLSRSIRGSSVRADSLRRTLASSSHDMIHGNWGESPSRHEALSGKRRPFPPPAATAAAAAAGLKKFRLKSVM